MVAMLTHTPGRQVGRRPLRPYPGPGLTRHSSQDTAAICRASNIRLRRMWVGATRNHIQKLRISTCPTGGLVSHLLERLLVCWWNHFVCWWNHMLQQRLPKGIKLYPVVSFRHQEKNGESCRSRKQNCQSQSFQLTSRVGSRPDEAECLRRSRAARGAR